MGGGGGADTDRSERLGQPRMHTASWLPHLLRLPRLAALRGVPRRLRRLRLGPSPRTGGARDRTEGGQRGGLTRQFAGGLPGFAGGSGQRGHEP